MQNRIGRNLVVAVPILGLAIATVASAASEKEIGTKPEPDAQKVRLADLPTPVRATIDKEFPGARIDRIEKEKERGKIVYDVEANWKGKHVEMDVAGDGTVLTREESVPFASLPAAARAVAEKYFGSATGLQASKEVENSKTFYEVEGKKDGKKTALKLTEDGKQTETD
ncbi:MAG TPA: PepSY-like domain-containing protein [Verrucomicrobiae bacterium]|nr:PepSY-like domain-containing protein [Verrucomicrobiae bacterium]